jgi:MoxR-like ATPase
MAEPMLIAKQTDTKDELVLLPGVTNRHGLVAGATGTGKTVTPQVIARRSAASVSSLRRGRERRPLRHQPARPETPVMIAVFP